MGQTQMQKMTVALFGNPNVGKSTLFNTLTRMHQHTGNWPGKTVGIAKGTMCREGVQYTFVDLPGTYSLQGNSEDEKIAGEYLDTAITDCTVVVCDASALERSLNLALQVINRTKRVVVCVNLMDEASRRGIAIDQKRLMHYLQTPVVLTAAGRSIGIEDLIEKINYTARCPENLKVRYWEDTVAAAEQIAADCIRQDSKMKPDYRFQVDRLLVSRRFGLPLMFILLFVLVWLSVWGANYPSALLENLFDIGYRLLNQLFADAPYWLHGILVDGIYATCARVISVMLPPMAIFFTLFTLLEDIGYLPRMAFLLDPYMARCGACGKQALTLCMGLGCNAVGVMGCRIIDSPRERLSAILTNAMIPCNGRFPTLVLLGAIFLPQTGTALIVALCVALGAVGAVVVSGVLNRTFLRSEPSAFLLEMPPFRRPRLGKFISRCMIERILSISLRALYVAAPAGAFLWLASHTALLRQLSDFFDPVGKMLGMNGALLLGFVLALPANEMLIPIVFMIMTGAQSIQTSAGISAEVFCAGGLTWQMAVCAMVFTLFHWPCATTLMTIYRETNSIKKTAVAFALPTAVGTIICMMLNLILN